jgi:hypothetical protein
MAKGHQQHGVETTLFRWRSRLVVGLHPLDELGYLGIGIHRREDRNRVAGDIVVGRGIQRTRVLTDLHADIDQRDDDTDAADDFGKVGILLKFHEGSPGTYLHSSPRASASSG